MIKIQHFRKQFKKEVKLARKRRKNIEELDEVMQKLVDGKKLPAKYKDHKLQGTYSECRECHIESNWLLIYEISEDKSEIFFARTGTHSDLYK